MLVLTAWASGLRAGPKKPPCEERYDLGRSQPAFANAPRDQTFGTLTRMTQLDTTTQRLQLLVAVFRGNEREQRTNASESRGNID